MQRNESSVLDALTAADAGLSINDVTDRCGGTTSQTSCTLAALEAKGLVRFGYGHWTLGTRLLLPTGKRLRPA